MLRPVVVLAALVLVSTLAVVFPAQACNEIACTGQVLRVYNSSTFTYIELDDKANQPCALLGGRYWRIVRTAAIHDDVNAAALVAASTGARLMLRRLDSDSTCTIVYSVLLSDLRAHDAESSERDLEEALVEEREFQRGERDSAERRK